MTLSERTGFRVPGWMKPLFGPAGLASLAMLLFALWNLYRGEILPVNNSLGWDGSIYAGIARHFPEMVFQHQTIDPYDLQRSFPIALVHYGLRVIRAPLEDAYIIHGFRILTIWMLVLSAFFWGLTMEKLGFSRRAQWLGYTGLFLNCAVLKMFFYYAITIDVTAFALSVFLFYFYVRKSQAGVLLITLCGAFTWPTMLYAGLILFVFPRQDTTTKEPREKAAVAASLLFSAAIAGGAAWLYYLRGIKPAFGGTPAIHALVPVSLAAVAAYSFWGSREIFRALCVTSGEKVFRKSFLLRLITALLVYSGFRVILSFYPGEPRLTLLWFIEQSLVASVTRPFIFYVITVVYFGPVMILALFFWRDVTRAAARFGLGLVLFLFLHFMISVGDDARKYMNVLPAVVALTIMAAEKRNWENAAYVLLAAVALVFSKVWMTFNHGPMTGSNQEFPLQYIFMSQGPVMNHAFYALQGAVILGTLLLFHMLLIQKDAPLRNAPPE